MRNIATSRMFEDGHHRTASVVTETFLHKNGAVFKETDEDKIYRFIKDIRKYSNQEIEDWLKNGSK